MFQKGAKSLPQKRSDERLFGVLRLHFLREAATFYRAVGHGQRVSTGNAEGGLPTSPAQFEVLTDPVKRWTPEHLHEQRLDVTLREIRRRTREFFNRLFGSA